MKVNNFGGILLRFEQIILLSQNPKCFITDFYYLKIAKLVPIMLIIFHLLYSKANFQTLLKIKFFFKTVCICLEILSSKQSIDNATSCKLIYLLVISYIKHRLRIQNISGKFMQKLQSFCHSVIFLSLTLFGFRNRKYRTIL